MKLSLTDEQKMVVDSKDNNILLIAGAGTGKTRVLTERLKKLLIAGVDPQGIIAITYTNLATNEMKDRLKLVEGINECFIGTIHSFANSILKSMNMYFKVLTDDEYIKIAGKLIRMHCKEINIFQFIEIKRYYEKPDGKKTLKDFSTSQINEYHALCGSRNVSYIPTNIYLYADKNDYITFERMIEIATDKYKSNFVEHLLVDEFQDVGTLEYEFIKKLNAKNNFFVGDDWQSIYSFSGANVNIMLDIYKDTDFKIYMLTKNFRNPKQILNTGRKIIEQLEDFIEKDNLCMNGEYGKVSTSSMNNLLGYVKPGMIILTRTNKEVEKINNILSTNGIDVICLQKSGKTQKELNEIFKSEKVKVMTIHQSKGLEFDRVVVYGKNMKINRRTVWKDSDEEKKIMYVAITRAKNELVILN
jgi:DNA helicase-2/ATP-dependent DNA helicase PcrA